MGTQILRLLLVACTGVIVSVVFLAYTVPLLVQDSSQATESIFVYGTLRNELIRFYACRCFVLDSPTTVQGFEKIGLNIVPSSTAAVDGDVIRVTPQQLQFIDTYENIPDTYTRSTLTIEGSEHFVYMKKK